MPRLNIIGFKYDLQKVSMTKLLRSKADISLKESTAITDAVLKGKFISLEIEDEEIANSLVVELTKIGAIVEIEKD